MKVMQINAVYGVGSTGLIVEDIHKALKKASHESYVLGSIAKKSAYDIESFIRIGNTLDHKGHAFFRRIWENQGWHSRLSTKIACKKIEKIKPDVVHLHNLHSNYINLPYLLKFLGKKDIPTLITLHDCWFYTGYCTYYMKHNYCSKWKDGCRDCPAVRVHNKKRVEKILETKKSLYSSINHLGVSGVSKWTTEDAEKSILNSSNNIKCIYNWIDRDLFKPYDCKEEVREKYGIEKNKKIILGVSQSWSERKGLNEFILLSEKLKDSSVVILVGEGSQVPQSESLKCVGFTSNKEELIKLYSAADVFVNPSRMETFGLVTVEAMACGTPVVAYNNTGSAELVPDTCGSLVSDGDMQALLTQVEAILDIGKEYYMENCIKWVKINFNKKTQIDKFIEFYKELSSEK